MVGAETWHFKHPVQGDLSVHVDGPFHVNNGMAAVPALVAGLGLTALPEAYVVQELQDGRLEEVLRDWPITPAVVHVITPPGRARPARVRALIDFLRRHFAAQPWAQGIET